jgi:ankyrin repeat domain-containing protein 50
MCHPWVLKDDHIALTESERIYTSYFKRDLQPTLPIERVEGTCRWLLDTSQYQKWQEDGSSAILWITGDAGCGKTTLTSFMTEVLRTETTKGHAAGPRPEIMAFFCAKDISAQNEGQSIVCGLLISILTSRKNVIRQVKTKFAPVKQEFRQSLESLWDVLMFALDVASCDRYYIIIDALDECQAQSRGRLLMCIRRMLASYQEKNALHHKKLKLLFTSQPQTMTEWRALEKISGLYHVKIEDRPSGLTRDILTFIDYKVDELVQLRRCDLPFADELKKALYQKAQNSFLWVSLVLSYIKATILLQANNPQQVLAQLPDNLKEAYVKYLPSSTPQNAGVIRRCVQLLVASYRNLTLEEIRVFTSIDSQGYQLATQQQLTIFQNSLELMFGPLIRFPDLRVDFVHSTVKDFFLELSNDATHAIATTYGTDVASAHLALAEACVNFLLCEEMDVDFFNNIGPSSAATVASISPVDPVPNDGDSSMDIFDIHQVTFLKDEEDRDDEACSQITDLFAPFDYAATNWAHHFASCEHIAPETLARKVRLLSKPSNVQVSNWYKYMAHQSRTIVPSFGCLNEVLVAAMFDHPEALRKLLSYRHDKPDALEAQCKLGLFWAALQGHARTVQAFLEHGTNPNFLESGQSPLIVAVLGGRQDIGLMLLQTPLIDPNFRDKSTRSPLMHAVASDEHEIIRMLLAHEDILVDLQDHFGFTALLEAAHSGCEQCLRYLQSDGRSKFTRRDKKGRNVLSYAAGTESVACVDLVLKNLAPEEAQCPDSSGRNAISYAAERSLVPIVKRLWRSQISASQRDQNGRNAISWAVSRPSTVAQKDEENTVLQFLVEKFPHEVDVKDNFGWTPLAWALDRPGDLTSVKILVEVGGVDVNQQDQSGRSVLSWAASGGFEDITRYLLQVPGIKQNLRDFTGRTPISHAAGNGSFNELRLLLNSRGIDPYITDDQDRSPLDWARLNHHEEVVQELSFLDST